MLQYQLDRVPPGSVVSTYVSGIEHFGILTARQTIISASKSHRIVVEDTPEDFADRRPVKLYGPWSSQPWQLTIQRARAMLGQPYDLFKMNCEHFVRYCHGLPPESPQLAKAILLSAVVFGVFLFADAA